jgi:hypothetical protein
MAEMKRRGLIWNVLHRFPPPEMPDPATDRRRLPSVRQDAEFEMFLEHQLLVSEGLLDPGQPTRWSHLQYQRALQTCPRVALERHSCIACEERNN